MVDTVSFESTRRMCSCVEETINFGPCIPNTLHGLKAYIIPLKGTSSNPTKDKNGFEIQKVEYILLSNKVLSHNRTMCCYGKFSQFMEKLPIL